MSESAHVSIVEQWQREAQQLKLQIEAERQWEDAPFYEAAVHYAVLHLQRCASIDDLVACFIDEERIKESEGVGPHHIQRIIIDHDPGSWTRPIIERAAHEHRFSRAFNALLTLERIAKPADENELREYNRAMDDLDEAGDRVRSAAYWRRYEQLCNPGKAPSKSSYVYSEESP